MGRSPTYYSWSRRHQVRPCNRLYPGELQVVNTDPDLTRLTLVEQVEGIRARSFSCHELVTAHLDRIDKLNAVVNAFTTIHRDTALATADRVDRKHVSGSLAGAVVSVKDNLDEAGIANSGGLHPTLSRLPAADSAVVARVRRAGAIIIGRCNLHELAVGATTDNPHYGATRNPWDLTRIPGGSSGGSAAAVASRFCAVSVATDTGGSVRVPATLCGVVGLKPTYGRISSAGVIPLSWSLDTVGLIARTVDDAERMLGATSRRRNSDLELSAHKRQPTRRHSSAKVRGVRIALPTNFGTEFLDPSATRVYAAAARVLADRGWEVDEVDIPALAHAPAIQYVIGRSETAAAHSHLLRQRKLIGQDAIDRIESGRHFSAVDYLQAQRGRAMLIEDIQAILARYDALMCPGSGTSAAPRGKSSLDFDGRHYSLMELYGRFTGPFSSSGHPVVAVPCGLHSDGLPLGVQVVTGYFQESTALHIARALEAELNPGVPDLDRVALQQAT